MAEVVTAIPASWRLENIGNYYSWRWQIKGEDGKTVTYTTSTGKTGYRRGSKYIGKMEQVENGKQNS